ncbi:MAG: 5'-nucleotidase C-terminal domain-containing protein [Muribaculum sp.]|nr:5'-nucleotidase C-terminal domain-containing protein [Muribaculum sp.]
MKMKPIITAMAIASTLLYPQLANSEEINMKIVETTDIHGNFFPYNFITLSPGSGSLSRVATRVNFLRDSIGKENLVLLDNGDILQGQPTAYYYNFIDTVSPHIAAQMLKFMGYDAQTIGNHDVETGHPVYDRYQKDLSPIPFLGANVIDKSTGKPYLKPYTIINKNSIKIAVFGLLTPAIPAWLPENIWSGLTFEDMVESAKKWVPQIIENEKPDLLIGLFHSGHDSSRMTGKWRENASLLVAEQVPGFDIVFMGHDHQVFNSANMNDMSSTPVVLNPANNANFLAEVDVKFNLENGKVVSKEVIPTIFPLNTLEPDKEFLSKFEPERKTIYNFVTEKIGKATGDFSVRDSYFGPSAFMELLHDLQLEISGAEISFAAPLSYDALIKEGDLLMSDMFTLYKYENMLYTMALTGQEIKDYLEMSYSLWTDQLNSPDGHLLLFAKGDPAKGDYAKLENPAYNFDSAAGIKYTVDVTKPRGSKINIISMADGKPFKLDKTYKVAINSYRGNGGGNLLTDGAGIPHDQLTSRILSSTDKDLRFYLIQAIKDKGVISPKVTENWHFEPAEIVKQAADRDRKILFPDNN